MSRNTIFDKLWDTHLICSLDERHDLLAIDRIYLHDLCGAFAFERLDAENETVYRVDSVIATPDHTLASSQGRNWRNAESSRFIMPKFTEGCRKHGIKLFDDGHPCQGIVHVMGPENGYTLPGMTVVCGDSHTCTHGAMGALALGVGTNELSHVLATSGLIATRPECMKVLLTGHCEADVVSMDVALALLERYGVDSARGYAVVFEGPAVARMPMEQRFTLCNMAIEMGAYTAIIPPDETTLQYCCQTEALKKNDWLAQLKTFCYSLRRVEDVVYDREITMDVSKIKRHVSWGIHPGESLPVDDVLPDMPKDCGDAEYERLQKAFDYMRLKPSQRISGTKIDYVFIGSCANARLSDLQAAADCIHGKHVADGVKALVVAGSEKVKMEAERLGLDKVFIDAGFCWGEPCCGLCVGSNGETIPSGKRCISTTNRNFIGRQGQGALTHLASPITAALSAIAGTIV